MSRYHLLCCVALVVYTTATSANDSPQFQLKDSHALAKEEMRATQPVLTETQKEKVHARTSNKGRNLGSATGAKANPVCVDYTIDAYYEPDEEINGLPEDTIDLPPTISTCELEMLHAKCVERINMYREGTLKFSDGSEDSNVAAGLSPLVEATAQNECASEQAMGDLHYNLENGGGCAGAHHTAFSCDGWSGSLGQNSCCARGGGAFGDDTEAVTYDRVLDYLYECLQDMWDEGIEVGEKGHWETMRSETYAYAACGFAWDENGRVFMNQDFSSATPTEPACSCEGMSAPTHDGCGGFCVECDEPEDLACRNEQATPYYSSSCSGSGSYCTCFDHMSEDWLPGCEDAYVNEACPVSCGTCPQEYPTCPQTVTQPMPPTIMPPPPPPYGGSSC